MFAFFFDPIKMGISVFSLLLSIAFFILMAKQAEPRKKALLIYSHLFTLIFPVVYYFFTNSCMSIAGAGFCNDLKPALMIFFVTLGSSIALGYLLTPLILKFSSKTLAVSNHRYETFMAQEAQKAGIAVPSLHVIDSAQPIAFCVSILKPRIYVSIGMAELLNKKEMEAVLLHELGHIKHQSSWLKLSTYLHKLASPFSVITDFNSVLRASERAADRFAIGVQGTSAHVLSAKKKIREFGRITSG